MYPLPILQHKKLWLVLLSLIVLLFMTDPALAASSGGGLPFDSWLTKVQKSVTGPFAFTSAIVGLVAAGASLIFGGDMNGFMRTLIFFVLALAFLVAAQNTMTAITGKGAEITTPSYNGQSMEQFS